MSKHLEGQDLSALFGLDLDTGTDPAPADVAAILCDKCNGRGNFVGYTGRIVGKCFACAGTGLARSAGAVLTPDACPKCTGTGEWRSGKPCFACDGSGKVGATRATTISVDAIVTAFATAREQGIKSPKLRLSGFTFSRAPDHGKNAGAIYVKRSGSDDYLGKVTGGAFHPVRECDDPTKTAIIAAAADPHAAAKAYGLQTKRCSCCGLTLTNQLSKELGIGPICRGKYGWA